MELVVVKLSGLGASWIDIGMDALSTNDFVTVMCAHSHTSPFVPCPSDVDRSLEFTCSQDVVASKIDKIRIVALRPPLPASLAELRCVLPEGSWRKAQVGEGPGTNGDGGDSAPAMRKDEEARLRRLIAARPLPERRVMEESLGAPGACAYTRFGSIVTSIVSVETIIMGDRDTK